MRRVSEQEAFVRLAGRIGMSWQDVANAKRQARRIDGAKQRFRRCHKALRPRHE